MGSTLSSDRVQTVLAQLREIGEREDGPAKLKVRTREAELGTRLHGHERATLGMNASLAITPEVGQLLYALTLAARPTVIIEFGASLGSSTIYLASALRDLGAGSIITTELLSEKAQQASSNLAAAGLGDLVIADMSHGDPHHNRYRDYVTDPARPYVTTEIRLDAGLVISTRAPTRAM